MLEIATVEQDRLLGWPVRPVGVWIIERRRCRARRKPSRRSRGRDTAEGHAGSDEGAEEREGGDSGARGGGCSVGGGYRAGEKGG